MIESGVRVSDATILPGAFFRYVGAWAQAPLARSVISGVVVGILSILFYLSYAALIFSGPLTPWLSYGMAATFVTGAIGGAAVSLFSSLPFAIGGPDGSTSAVTAALVAALTGHMASRGADGGLLTATLVTLALSSALTGVLLCGLGVARAGRAIRFVPYPVIGGFLSGPDRQSLAVLHDRQFFERRQRGEVVRGRCGRSLSAIGPDLVEISVRNAGVSAGQHCGFLSRAPAAWRFAEGYAGPRLDVRFAVAGRLRAAMDTRVSPLPMVGIA
jgi:hypothetical protein